MKGFTLIELLVVVLIIAILSAVALPQYKLAVEKSKSSEGLLNFASLSKAWDLYVAETGEPPASLGELAVTIPNAEITEDGKIVTPKWTYAIQLPSTLCGNPAQKTLVATRYTKILAPRVSGANYSIAKCKGQLVCVQSYGGNDPGPLCSTLFNGRLLGATSGNDWYARRVFAI